MAQQLREGQTGTAPDGTRVIVRNGQIVPLDSGRDMSGTLTTRGPRGGVQRSGLNAPEQRALAAARADAAGVDTALSDLERFARLQEQQQTGGLLTIPGAPQVAAAWDPQIAEMNEISARLAPAQRQAGSGTMSDRDLALFLQSVPGAGRPEASNNAIIDRGRQEGARRQLYAQFLDRYAREYGTLNGAQEAWQQAYQPPPVANNSPVPRGNVNPTSAQLQAVERLNASGERNRRAVLGTRTNPRVPPEGFDINTLPAGDWYIAPNGQLRQVAREQANQNLRRQSGRNRVVSVRRAE